MRKPIPIFEPEVIAAAAAKYGGDDEKVATTAITSPEINLIKLSSRYDKAHELEKMAQMVEGLPQHLAGLIRSIWCNSKMGACYHVTVYNCCTAGAARRRRIFSRRRATDTTVSPSRRSTGACCATWRRNGLTSLTAGRRAMNTMLRAAIALRRDQRDDTLPKRRGRLSLSRKTPSFSVGFRGQPQTTPAGRMWLRTLNCKGSSDGTFLLRRRRHSQPARAPLRCHGATSGRRHARGQRQYRLGSR